MIGFNNNHNPFWIKNLIKKICNLYRHFFLNLKLTGEHLHDSWDFAEPNYLSVWDVGNMACAKKGEQMMLA